MREEEIRKYALLMKELGLHSLSVTEKGATICLENTQAAGGGTSLSHEERSGANETEGPDSYSVTSPMVGMFYAAPAENAAPYVAVGDLVKEGDILCIIEAMKLMNEIRAEKSGVIEKILVTNGQVVEYGTELMKIRKE